MSQSEILYVKGMNLSESEEEENLESAWDDRKLNDAYDKALKIANAEVAKRVAMSTNTQNGGKEDTAKNKKEKKSSQNTSTKKKHLWRAGLPCRSVYEGDGLEYEAFILRMINNEECVVRYLGYENSEIVPISSLKPTHGNDERTKQIEQALREKVDDGFGSQSPNPGEDMEASDRVPSPDSIDQASFQKKKRSYKKKNSNSRNNFELPGMPVMPNISMLRNIGSLEMPMPPPPMTFTSSDKTESEEQAISSMLLSWYMSGYYTGLYQGLKRSKENRNNV
ncbi:unnamed protein product [Arctia plantaginis]|uniref:Tudor domain-containing protein n=1 Tax=Arctia plantaginis TaxID=874455 RepID=A0A8S1B4R2_ARCPL|nr:unnamed protein product [Arctia plantaginis]CAB3253867.1 unnamed protein product [Arctia plantaginis]